MRNLAKDIAEDIVLCDHISETPYWYERGGFIDDTAMMEHELGDAVWFDRTTRAWHHVARRVDNLSFLQLMRIRLRYLRDGRVKGFKGSGTVKRIIAVEVSIYLSAQTLMLRKLKTFA